MNARPALSFREQYGPKSSGWTEGHFPPIVRFWTDDGSCWGVPFHQVIAVNYSPRTQTLLIHFSVGSILIRGPKAEAFLERFCEHKVALGQGGGKRHSERQFGRSGAQKRRVIEVPQARDRSTRDGRVQRATFIRLQLP